jgi:hypothetical protein
MSYAQNGAAIAAAWVTAKAQLATIQADAAQLASDLAALESTLATLGSLGATDVVEWIRRNARQTRLGYVPYVAIDGAGSVPMPAVFLVQPGTTRDTTTVDLRPISVTSTGAWLGLS